MVVDHQQPRHATGLYRSGGSRRCDGGLQQFCERRLGGCRFQDQGHGEGRAFAGRTVDHDIAAHQLRQAADDRQAEPGPAIAPGRRPVGLRKWLEQARLLRRVEPDTGVLDRQNDPGLSAAERHCACVHNDLAALGEFDRVAQGWRSAAGAFISGIGGLNDPCGEAWADCRYLSRWCDQ
jgi:hypothetical protein